jgi:hypothetical protein
VTGNVYVNNPNQFDVTGVAVTDAVDGETHASCPVSDGSYTVNQVLHTGVSHTNGTIPSGIQVAFPYTCTYSQAPAASAQTNRGTATWDVSNGLPDTTNDGTAGINWSTVTPTDIHNAVNVSDGVTSTSPALTGGFALSGPTGTFPSGSISSTTSYSYTRTLTVPHNCLTVNNTATFSVTDPEDANGDTDDSGSASATAKVCRTPANTGALTMGYWQNKNGQATITNGASTAGVCNSGTWLRQFAPFTDLSSTASCSAVAAYDVRVFKAATCSGPSSSPCNAMLKAQMLATALDVFFSTTGLGSVNIDLTNICKMIDGSGGTATCSGTYEDASPAFDGYASRTVLQMLTIAASHSSSGGTTWYGNVKAMQVLAKDAFDAVNNQVAFTI